MVLPFAIDLQIAAGKPFLLEARLDEKGLGRFVCREAGGLDAMQPQGLKDERQERANGVLHIALAREPFADPVAERAALRDPPPHIRERAAAKEGIVLAAKDEKSVGRIVARFMRIPLQPPAEGAFGELITCPLRFPRG